MRARGVHFGEVNGHDQNLLLVRGRFRKNFAGRASDETLAPEFQAVAAHAFDDFVADAVDRCDEAAVGDGVRTLDGFQCAVLAFAVFFFLAGMPADGGRVKKDLRALHGREPRGFGIPLVPADQHADFSVARLPGIETEVAGREIKFFVEQRIVRDVHLAIDAEQRTVRVNDGGGVVINAGRAFL